MAQVKIPFDEKEAVRYFGAQKMIGKLRAWSMKPLSPFATKSSRVP